jgi:hypothetical protein
LVLCVFGAKACVLSFPDYPEADVCDAGLDAGLELPTAEDPVLRGCDAGAPPSKSRQKDPGLGLAGAAGTSGAE